MANTTTIPKNINSYDSGNKPYKHDVYRGKWSSIQDFYFSCIIHSFGGKYFSFVPLFMIKFNGVSFIIPYVICLFLFTVPIFFIQSFLGQFSTSGFISAFRIAPLFKGLGYTILLLNITSVFYYSILASFPLVYIFTSFSPQLPWMSCNNFWNTINCIEMNDNNGRYYLEMSWSSVEFLENKLIGTSISWELVLCIVIIWILVTIIIIQRISMIGKILQYFSYVAFATVIITCIRVLFLPNFHLYFLHFFASYDKILSIEPWLTTSIFGALTFGSGWGTILTMASYNNFNSNISKSSWIICCINFGILTLCGLLSFVMEEYLIENYNFRMYPFDERYLKFPYAIIPFFFGHLNGGNIWSIIFFVGLFLGDLSGLIIQTLSILTAIFDEFERFRPYKRELTLIFITILMLISLAITISRGINLLGYIFAISGGATLFICFIELMIVLWIYGRLRFQRDVKFMINETFSTWKFFMMRFATPIYVFLVILYYMTMAYWSSKIYAIHLQYLYYSVILFIKLIPILIFPIYIIYKFKSSSGTFCERFKQLCRPTDWYPADPIERHNYESIVNGNSDILIDDNAENLENNHTEA